MTTVTSTHPYAHLNGGTAAREGGATTSSEVSAQDRFLTMLVAQMKNQDPLNPMENAEVTSQMAQINTVTGIEKVNNSLQTMLSQLMQAQAMQGAALIGRDVLLPGNSMYLVEGAGNAGFDLGGKADRVTVEILDGAGKVLDSVDLGPMPAGRHHFHWQAENPEAVGNAVNYRVTATAGSTAVEVTTYARDTVGAISTLGGALELDLVGGRTVTYDQVRAVL
jgi:flagellar basal-body rod modification protein FlgD